MNLIKMTTRINVTDWLSADDISTITLLKDAVEIDKISDQLLNFGAVHVYKNITKRELAEEVSESLGLSELDDLLEEEGLGYFEIKYNKEYLYLPEIAREDNGIFLGKIKNGFAENEFVKVNKHEWACNWYWSYGHASNNSMSCGLDRYYDKTVNKAFKHTWMTSAVWDKFRIGMKELGSPLGRKEKEDVNAIGAELDNLWDYLMAEYKKVELIIEEPTNV